MNDWQEAEQRVERAQELFAHRQWSEALVELKHAVAINPHNAAWHFYMGLTLDELDRFGEAIECYRRALDLGEDDLDTLHHLGMDLTRVGDFRKALAAFERIEGIDASFEPAYCHRILIYSELGDHEKAEEMFYMARHYKEDCPDCYYNMGLSLAARQRDPKAIFCFQRSLDLEEHYPQAHLRMAEVLWRGGDLEGARQHYVEELRAEPGRTETILDIGQLLDEMGRSDEAGEKFRHAIEIDPHNAAAHYSIGRWMLSKGRVGEAETALKIALRLDPTYPGAHLCLARSYHRRGRFSEARRQLRAELLLRPGDPDILLSLANMLMDGGDTRSAGACLRRLVQITPRNVAAHLNLAVVHFARGQYDEGIACCHEALRCDAEDATAMYNLALAYERLGNYAKAGEWIGRAIRIDPQDVALQRLDLRIRLLRLWKNAGRVLRSMWRWPWRH